MDGIRRLADIPHEPRVPLARVRDGSVELDAYPPGGFANPYTIDIERVKTPEQVLNWLRHLSGKRWFTRQLCRDFINTLAEHSDWAVGVPL